METLWEVASSNAPVADEADGVVAVLGEVLAGFGNATVSPSTNQSQQGMAPAFVPGLRVLHLWHPRNWEGTEVFL